MRIFRTLIIVALLRITQTYLQKHKMQKFATANSNFEKIYYFSHASSYNVDVYQFSAKSG